MGHRITINNVKSAGGIFKQDRFLALAQAVVNIIVSIFLVKLMGLPGVFLGTIIQGTLSTVIRPILVYPIAFNVSAKEYFKDSLKFIFPISVSIMTGVLAKQFILQEVTILSFILFAIAISLLTIIILYLFSKKRKEFIYLNQLVMKKIARRIKNA